MKQKLKPILKRLLVLFITITLVFLALFLCFDAGLFKSFASKNLDKNLITALNTEIELYDKDNNLMHDDNYIKQRINISDLPPYVLDAFICTEDKDFYNHNGINYKSILRAIYVNLKNGSYKQGGSTISQQLIKNTHLSNEKTLTRKIDEMLLTQQLEKEFSKDEILQSYLNVIYFGQGTFGIEQASQKYFSKSAKNP